MPLPTNTGQLGGLPSTGIGNIPPAVGTPNSPAANVGMPVRPMPGNVGMPSQPPQMIGNMKPPAPNTGSFAQLMSQLHPTTTAALKSIPPQALQQLHQAGLIHPGLMQHLTGNQ